MIGRAGVVVVARLALSAGAGALLFASFPPRPWWFLAPIAIALIGYVLTERRTKNRPLSKKGGFLYGFVFGLGFFLPLLPWIGVYVGPLPWIALASAESVFLGLFGVLAVVVSRLPVAPLWLTLVWSVAEWLRSTVPFGGFPWGRVAFGQSESPLLPLASIGGAPLLSAAVVLVGMGAVVAVREWRSRERRRVTVGVSIALALIAPIAALALRPGLAGPLDGSETITVAAIQGSVPRLGLDFNAQRRKVLDNHVAETIRLAEDVEAGRTSQPDVVIWPENASDVDPLRDQQAAAAITSASVRVGAPILVGSVLSNTDGTSTNAVIAWDGVDGPGEQHDKKIVQPFGEYLPYRSFFRLFSSYADSAGNFVPGDGDGVVHVMGPAAESESGSGTLAIGIATCYEVAFDRAPLEAVRAGAGFLAVPTNNATFGDTEMTYQQLAMSRVRAVEHSRSVVVAATSGVSAVIAPDGSVTSETPLFDADHLVEEIGVRTDTTIATRLGPSVEHVLVGLGLAGVIGASLLSRRPTRS